MAEIESNIKPDFAENDIGWKAVAFINIRPPIPDQLSDLTYQHRLNDCVALTCRIRF